jgi:hypothetical protein
MEKTSHAGIDTMMIRKGDKSQNCDQYHQVRNINGKRNNGQIRERTIMTYSMRI